jgi:hypothetical protein
MSVSRSDTVTLEEVRRAAAEAVAAVEGCHPEDVESRAASNGGDLEIDSRVGEVVIARVESAFGGDELARASDLEPEQVTSLRTLSGLLHSRLSERGFNG